jgi:hypothetical protein
MTSSVVRLVLVGLALTTAPLGVNAQAPRDLSTPASRLVGHWATTGNVHYYFGPVDSLDIGSLTWVEIDRDSTVVKHRYKIISQARSGERLTIQVLFGSGGDRVDQYVVSRDGTRISWTLEVAGISVANNAAHIDDKVRPNN